MFLFYSINPLSWALAQFFTSVWGRGGEEGGLGCGYRWGSHSRCAGDGRWAGILQDQNRLFSRQVTKLELMETLVWVAEGGPGQRP